MPASSKLVHDLSAQVGPSHVLTRDADRAAYAFDSYGAAGLRALPDVVVFPASTQEVADTLRVCAHHEVPVVPRGAGTGYSGGAVADGGVILNLTRLSRVLGVEPEAMRIAAQAGVVTSTVHRHAAEVSLLFPPDPGSATTSTTGGNIACCASGARAFKYGNTADYLVGATAVLADGRTVRLGEGGDGAGLLLLRLLCGSEGTLAVVTEAIFRLVPAPFARGTVSATFATVAEAAEAALRISAAGVVPSALELLDGAALDALAAVPDIDPVPRGTGALVIAEVDGGPADVSRDTELVREALEGARARTIDVAADPSVAGRLWKARKSISAAVALIMIGKVNEDVCVPRDAFAAAVDAARRAGESRGLRVVTFGHLADGVVHATFLVDPRRPGDRERGEEAARELSAEVLRLGGSVTGEHGIGVAKLAVAERQFGDGTLALMRRIKAQLDPANLLNPGKKIPPPAAQAQMSAQAAGAAAHH
jgi:glycolate oxidase subunit GlcD